MDRSFVKEKYSYGQWLLPLKMSLHKKIYGPEEEESFVSLPQVFSCLINHIGYL